MDHLHISHFAKTRRIVDYLAMKHTRRGGRLTQRGCIYKDKIEHTHTDTHVLLRLEQNNCDIHQCHDT